MAELSEEKRREYQRLMTARNGQPRSPVVAIPDPFAEYSLTDFENEVSILDAAGKAWQMQFCQATTGFMGRAGGCWIAYAGHTPRAVIHAEQFTGKSADQKEVNFWAEYLMRGKEASLAYMLKLTILARFEDGVFVRSWEPEEPLPKATVGTRIAKGVAYQDCVNMVIAVPMAEMKSVAKKK